MKQMLAYRADGLKELLEAKREAEEHRFCALNLLVRQLGSFDPDGDSAEFSQTFAVAQQVLALDDLDMSRLLKVSRPTVSRWRNGESAPHRLARRAIVTALASRARSEARRLRESQMVVA